MNIPYQSGTFVTTEEPIWANSHLKSIVYFRIHLMLYILWALKNVEWHAPIISVIKVFALP